MNEKYGETELKNVDFLINEWKKSYCQPYPTLFFTFTLQYLTLSYCTFLKITARRFVLSMNKSEIAE